MRRLNNDLFCVLLLALLGLSPGSYGATEMPMPAVPMAYVRAAQAVSLPAEIAYFAALSQSGMRLEDGCLQPWPWTLTFGSVTHHYPSRAEAQAVLLTALRLGIRPIKVGLMQVNLPMVASNSYSDSLDPDDNLRLGLRLLLLRFQSQHDGDASITQLAQRFHRSGHAGLCTHSGKLMFASTRTKFQPSNQRRQHVAMGNSSQIPHISEIVRLVNAIAPRYAIDPALVMAVIQQESGFNTAALSDKQAQGLMQLIPETAQRFGVHDQSNIEENIRGGIAYLHWLLRHFQGDVVLTLAGYNAGEGAVDKYQGIPPYRETQRYVKSIMAQYPRALHPVPPPLPS